MSANLSPIDVLLAVKEPMLRDGLSRYLVVNGYRVSTATEGVDPWRLLDKQPFDLAVVDFFSGEQLRQLRLQDPALQVMVLTGEHAPSGSTTTSIPGIEYVGRPRQWVDIDRLLHKFAEVTRLTRENQLLRRLLNRDQSLEESTSGTSAQPAATLGPAVGGRIALEALTRAHVLAVLQQHQGNKARTARALGINRRSLYRLLAKYETAVCDQA